jgi:hypothetical protein
MTDLAITIKGLKKNYKKDVLNGAHFDPRVKELRKFWERWEFVSSKINELKEKI